MSVNEITLFQVLDQLHQKNYDIHRALTPSEQKKFVPIVLMKWMFYSGSSDPIALQNVNRYVFTTPAEQQLSLLASAGRGSRAKSPRWKWKAAATKKGSVAKETAVMAVMAHYNITHSTAQSVLPLLSDEELCELVELNKQ
jgi:alpha-mannosidase